MFQRSLVVLLVCLGITSAYFDIAGQCPQVRVKDNFQLSEFLGLWYQVGHHASDGRQQTNCTSLKLETKSDGIFLNQTRVELGLFQRYSYAKIKIPINRDEAAKLTLVYHDGKLARRVATRNYIFWIIDTNYSGYAVVYTCQNSEDLRKHFVYIWVLSRTQELPEEYKQQVVTSVAALGLPFQYDDFSDETCNANSYDSTATSPVTFRHPVSFLEKPHH